MTRLFILFLAVGCSANGETDVRQSAKADAAPSQPAVSAERVDAGSEPVGVSIVVPVPQRVDASGSDNLVNLDAGTRPVPVEYSDAGDAGDDTSGDLVDLDAGARPVPVEYSDAGDAGDDTSGDLVDLDSGPLPWGCPAQCRESVEWCEQSAELFAICSEFYEMPGQTSEASSAWIRENLGESGWAGLSELSTCCGFGR